MNPTNNSQSDDRRRPAVPNATVVRVAGPEDLLAYIPYRLGFEPVESLVAVSLTGPRQRVGLVARVDLDDLRLREPGDLDGHDGAATATWLSDHVVADGADRAVVVLYTATDTSAASGAARRAVELMRARLERRLPGVEVWLVTPTGFRALDCADPLCCPPNGRPLGALKSTRVAAHMVLEGRTVAGTREERYALRPASEVARTQARRAAARWADTYQELLRTAMRPDGHRVAGGAVAAEAVRAERMLARWGTQSLGLWRTAVGLATAAGPGQTAELSPAALGKLGAALADLAVRDAVLLSLAPGTQESASRTARRAADASTDQATGAVMAGIIDQDLGVPPDEEITRAARTVLEAIVTHVPRSRRAPALLLLGLVAWWHGDGGLASERVSAALVVDPGYRLALLLRGAIAGGVPPGWVRREQASFKSAGPEHSAAV